MKWGFAAVAPIGALIVFIAGYEFYEDMRLAGMPRKEIDISIKSDCPTAMSEVLSSFALRRNFSFKMGRADRYQKGKLVGSDQYFELGRWNAHMMATQHGDCSDRSLCYWAYVDYKGWLWWTDLAEADQFSADIISTLKKSSCVRRATVILTTKSPT